jgi:hypothetical protein
VESVEKAVADHPCRKGGLPGLCAGIVGIANLTMGRAVGEVLDEFAAVSPRFRGIRHMTAIVDDVPNWGCDQGQVMLPASLQEGWPNSPAEK